MKHLFLSLATTTTLLILILTTTTASGYKDKAVYDANDQPLIVGEEYYIIPYSYYKTDKPPGGGLKWKKANNYWQRCPPYYVVQCDDDNDNDNNNLKFGTYGEVITLKPSTQSDDDYIITLATNLNIGFYHSPKETLPDPYCGEATGEWKVEGNVVELGRQSGIIDPSKYVFTIEISKGGYAYIIKFCPKGEHDGRYACGGLGLITENGERRLVVNGTNPLEVLFDMCPYIVKKYTSYA